MEAHFRPLFLDSPLRNYRLQNWFRDNEQFQTLSCSPFHSTSSGQILGEGSFNIPTVSFNAVYQLCHIYRHLFDEGIGLRQLLDYYFVLRALHIEQGELFDRSNGSSCSSGSNGGGGLNCSSGSSSSSGSSGGLNRPKGIEPSEAIEPIEPLEPQRFSMAQWAEGMGIAVKSNAEIMHTLSRFGMKKFASATMYVLQTVFAMPDVYLICQPNEKEGKFFTYLLFV